MTAPDSHLARFNVLVEQMPAIARAAEAFADQSLRERAYCELVGILNPTDPQDNEYSPLTTALLGEAQPGESVVDTMARLLGELNRWRAAGAERQAAENWTPLPTALELLDGHRGRTDIG